MLDNLVNNGELTPETVRRISAPGAVLLEYCQALFAGPPATDGHNMSFGALNVSGVRHAIFSQKEKHSPGDGVF